jgi:hypothetical protein
MEIAMRAIVRFVIAILSLGVLFVPSCPVGAQGFADPRFQKLWEHDQVVNPDYWGAPLTGGIFEPYAEAPGKVRLVQYFAKGRMTAVASEWLVDDQLNEILSGKRAIGRDRYEYVPPPALPVAGDSPGLTYAALSPNYKALMAKAPLRPGGGVTLRVSATGEMTTIPEGPTSGPESLDPMPPKWRSYNTLLAFADYWKQHPPPRGDIWDAPSTEPFRSTITVSGTQHDVIVQIFAYRILLYVPDNPEPSRVLIADTGRHYLAWRYPAGPPAATTGPLPIAQMTDAAPGATTLASGDASVSGNVSFAMWCTARSSGSIAQDEIGYPYGIVVVPPEQLTVTGGATLTFAYLGSDPLSTVEATFADLSQATPLNLDDFIALTEYTAPVPVALTNGQGTFLAKVPAGDYIVTVSVTQEGGYLTDCTADYVFHVIVANST